MEGLLYEPRAFWSVARIDSSASTTRPPRRVRFDRQHFMNGERFPVTLTKLCVAPINYTFDRYEDADPLSAANLRNCSVAALEFSDLQISAPQRQYYIRNPGDALMFTPEANYTPAAAGENGSPSFASSLWGVSRWTFDKPMVVPKLGDLELELGSYTQDGTLVGLAGSVAGTVQFEEVGSGLFGAQSRPTRQFLVRAYEPAPGAYTFPFGPDGFGPPTQGTTNAVWPQGQGLSARRYGAENPTSMGSIPVTGFAVALDQIAYDLGTATGHVPALVAGTVAPLALKIPVRARMRNGGTGAYWWRQGAPLALVTPTITPAQVYSLREPITLGPGDRLEIELTVPPPVLVGEDLVGSIYQLGVSLTGYAAIEA